MASPIRPQYFCSRPNGTLTPLVALDELPAHISIRGVPRVLSPGDTQGMTSLGTVSPRAQFYVVDGISSSSTRASSNGNHSTQQRSRDIDIQNSLLKVVTDDSLPTSQRLAFHALIQHGMAQNWVLSNPATSNWLASTGGGGGGAVGTGRQGPHYNVKKEYCSYWIRHGECDYQQQGCLYKHEMPTDPSMLERLGLRDIPRWYREKYGIPSLIPGGHHNSRTHVNHSQHWKDSNAPDRGTLKAIQYPSRSGPHGNADLIAGEADKNLKQKPVPNLHPVLPQPVVTTQGQNRTPFGTGNFPKGGVPNKQAAKHVPAQLNAPTAKKIDLLSFDPLPDYRGFDHVNGNMSEPPYSTATAEDVDRAQREDLVRSLQSLVPAPTSVPGNPELLPSPIDSTISQGRGTTRKQHQQRSRRLYQPRSQISIPESDPNTTMDIGPFKSNGSNNRQSSVATLSSPASAISKDSTQMTSPLAGPVVGNNNDVPSDPPTRVATPSMHSQSSSSSTSMKKLPSPFSRAPGDGNRAKPGPIGSINKGHRKKFAEQPHEDLIALGAGREN